MNELKRKRANNNGVATSHDTMALPKSKEKSKKNSPSTSVSARLAVPREEEERITPRAGRRLTIPREEIKDDYSAGEELDLTSGIAATIRRPGRHEWFRLYRNLELRTNLLILKSNPDAIDVEYFHIEPELRKTISNEINAVRVFPYYSLSAKHYGLWIVKVTVGNSWYESLQSLFSNDDDFFETTQIRVRSNKDKDAVRGHDKVSGSTRECTAATDR